MLSRRQVLRVAGAAGVGAALAWGLTAGDWGSDDRTSIVYAMSRSPGSGDSFESRTKDVPAEWHENLELAFEVQSELRSANLSSLLGSFAVPGSYDDPEASLSVDAVDEAVRTAVEDLARGIPVDLNVVDEIPPASEDEPTLAESHQVPDLDRKRVPSGYVCETDGSFGTLAPALYDERGRLHFATSNHVFGAAGRKETEHEGEPLSLVRDGDQRRIGSVVRGYPLADVVRVAPVDGYRPASEIARTSPGTVSGQYTKAGLADLMARGEKLLKVGAFSDLTAGEIEGIDGVTCYTGEVCKHGQLKWGNEETMTDGDSGSVNFHADPENPDRHVLVGGINNARTWWPGMDFTWGTAGHHLLDEYGLHF